MDAWAKGNAAAGIGAVGAALKVGVAGVLGCHWRLRPERAVPLRRVIVVEGDARPMLRREPHAGFGDGPQCWAVVHALLQRPPHDLRRRPFMRVQHMGGAFAYLSSAPNG